MQTKKAVTSKGKTESELFTMLKKDHRLFKDLLKQIEEERSDDIYERLKDELDVHMSDEEEYFYPLFEDDASLESKSLEAFEEHNLGRSVIDLIDGEKDDKVWLARIKVLKDVLEHHIKEEEKEIFPEASKKLSRKKLDDAAKKIKDQKDAEDEEYEEGEGDDEDEEAEEDDKD